MNFFFRNKDDGTFKHLDYHYLENKNSDGSYVGDTSNSEEEDAELGSLTIIDEKLDDKQPDDENLEGEREADLPLDTLC